jgi:hypothetical protein
MIVSGARSSLRRRERCLGMISCFSKIDVCWQWKEADRRYGRVLCGQAMEQEWQWKGSIYVVFQLDRFCTIDLTGKQLGVIVLL